ncbi:facilitated trehalose transporter Tret1-like [Rhodnius prolixus]|uniref:facilitated trehalose transporter Tret1-like n=1 Tax=Rhodnius prolixus TaxID=13249 RepID=UPI003D1896DF
MCLIEIELLVNSFKGSASASEWIATFSCYIAAIFTPICVYWISPYSFYLNFEDYPKLAPHELVAMISGTDIGSGLFCIPVGILAQRYGRKKVMLLSGVLGVAVWLITIFTDHIVALYIARLLQGVCIAIVNIISPVYVAEISKAKRRGTLCGFYTVFWNLGILYAFISAQYLPFKTYLLCFIALPIIFSFTFILMPESPYYYFMKNNPEKAKESLQWLRHYKDVEEIEEDVQKDSRDVGSWKELIATKKNRRALLIVLIVCFSRYLVGTTAIIAYSDTILTKAGQNIFTMNEQLIGIVLLFTICSAVASFFSDIVGRRKLLIHSLIGTAISNAMIALFFVLLELTSLQITSFGWIIYFCIYGNCIFTTIGLGQLMPTVSAEFFPSHTRILGGIITNLLAILFSYIQLYTFPIIAAEIGIYFNFIIFGAMATIGYIFVTIYVPESAGKTLAEINQVVKDISLCSALFLEKFTLKNIRCP